MRKSIFLFSVLTVIVGCKGVSTLQVYPEGQGLKALSDTEEVYLTKDKDAMSCKIIKIADMQVASKTYGGAARVNKVFRKLAREKGGNAVIGYNFWMAPNGGAWAAPHCEGTVVHSDLKCLKEKTTSVD